MGCGSVSKMTTSLEMPCEVPTPGVKAKIWIFNQSDILVASRKSNVKTSPDSKILSTLTLKADLKLRTIEGFKLSNVPTLGYNATAFVTYLPHNVQFAIFDKSAKGRLAVDQLVRQTDLIIIYRENGLTGNFIINGLQTGMSATNLGAEQNGDNAGAFVLDFSAALETEVPLIFQHMTTGASPVDDTEAYLESMTQAVTA